MSEEGVARAVRVLSDKGDREALESGAVCKCSASDGRNAVFYYNALYRRAIVEGVFSDALDACGDGKRGNGGVALKRSCSYAVLATVVAFGEYEVGAASAVSDDVIFAVDVEEEESVKVAYNRRFISRDVKCICIISDVAVRGGS